MVIKVYVSGISGNKEVKKRQQRVLLILDSKNVNYEVIDIAEPGAEDAKDFMQTNATSMGCTISDPSPRHPLPPQIFNDEEYCGDYDQFDMANEIDEMEKFLKLQVTEATDNLISNAAIKLKNGEVTPDEKEATDTTESEAIENEHEHEQENAESEEKSSEEAKAEKPEADQDTKDAKEDEDEAAADGEESKEEEGAIAGGEQTESEQDAAKTEEVTAGNDEEKAEA